MARDAPESRRNRCSCVARDMRLFAVRLRWLRHRCAMDIPCNVRFRGGSPLSRCHRRVMAGGSLQSWPPHEMGARPDRRPSVPLQPVAYSDADWRQRIFVWRQTNEALSVGALTCRRVIVTNITEHNIFGPKLTFDSTVEEDGRAD